MQEAFYTLHTYRYTIAETGSFLSQVTHLQLDASKI